MAKKTVGRTKVTSTVKGVRLDLSPVDHKRLERVAKDVGLSMTAFVRMTLLERLKAHESKG